jgi:hypothetical protein
MRTVDLDSLCLGPPILFQNLAEQSLGLTLCAILIFGDYK